MKLFKLDKDFSIICDFKSTSDGFRHIARLMCGQNEVSKASIKYCNRTWEAFEYQSVLHKVINEYTFTDAERKRYIKKVDKNEYSR